MQDFHRIRAWKKAHALAINIHRLAKSFPRGYGSLRSQIMRSAKSVAFTIVEGCGAATPNEFARFLDMSIKSLSEVEGELQMGNDYGIITDRDFHSCSEEVRVIRKMTWSWRQRVLGNDPSKSISHDKTEQPTTENGKRKQRKTNTRAVDPQADPEPSDGSLIIEAARRSV